jgi:plastocyanin
LLETRRLALHRLFLVTGVALALASCGGSDATTPSSASAVTITITPTGVTPKTVTVTPGGRVTFANTDSREHQMYSDPHPEHTSCPEFDQVGYLAPGQSRTTGNLNTTGTCNFHDHGNFENTSLRGSVVIR